MDFRQQFVEALDRMIESGAMTNMIDTALTKTMSDIINAELRDYSDFGKQLKEAVKKSLALNGSLDLPSYNDAVLKIVRKRMASLRESSIEIQVAKGLEKLLEQAPAEIKLSELVGQYVEMLKDREAANCSCDGEQQITLIVEHNPGIGTNDFRYICLDEKHGQSRFQCGIQISVMNGQVYGLRLGDRDLAKQLFVGPLYGFERTLFQMQAAKTKIVFDMHPDDIETSYVSE